jgi:hypothetical protein
MTTNDGNGPSFFARYIDGQEQPAQQHNNTNLVSQWVQEAQRKNLSGKCSGERPHANNRY